MKKILMIFTILISGLVLSGCIDSGDVDVVAPSFVGISIDGTNPFNGSELVTFYKERNENILVEVTINNPSGLDIRSIVIDGYYYKHTRFTEESTSTVIIFEIEAGDDLGEHVFSVDDIEYFDGVNVLTALVNEDNLFEVYVYKDAPAISRDSYEVTTGSIELGLNVTDNDDVIVDGSLIAEIYTGDSKLPQSFELTEGLQTITFTGLDSNKHYDIKVRANYDIDNSEGLLEEEVLYNAGFLTFKNGLPDATIGEYTISSTSITFDLEIMDEDSVLVPGGLNVVLKNEGYPDIVYPITSDLTSFTISDLLNDNDYTIQIVADYDLRDGLLTQEGLIISEQEITTSGKEVPLPVIDNLLIEENRVSFDLVVDDPEQIIDESSLFAELYIEGELHSVHAIENYHAEFQIFNVLSGFEFEIVIRGSYDLNDGSGLKTNQILTTELLNTENNDVPQIILYEKLVTQGYVILDLQVIDNNNTLKESVVVNLIEDDVIVGTYYITTETSQVVFSHEISYLSNYSVEFIGTYDLRDGEGIRDPEVLKKIVFPSFEPLPPAAEIRNISSNKDGFIFDVLVLDADATIIPGSVQVIIEKDGEDPIVLSMNDLGTLEFDVTDLLSNNNYSVKVIADYNVNTYEDGEIVLEEEIQRNQILFQANVLTETKTLPTTIISNPIATEDSISVDIFIQDLDDVTVPGSMYAQLYKNYAPFGDPILLSVGANNTVLFDEDILSDNSYDIFVYTDYDLNDGNEVIPGLELGSFTVKTEQKVSPSAIIQNLEAGTEEITVDIIINDTDNVITGNTKVVLYIGEEPFLVNGNPYEIALNKGLNPAVTFSNVYSDTNFNVRVVADYDLNDGVNVITDELLDYDFVKTSSNQLPSGEMFNILVGIDSITFNTLVEDDDSVITDGLQAQIFLDDSVIPFQTIDVSIGLDATNEFTGLISDSDYVIRLVTNYNLRDVAQEQSYYLLDTYSTSTNAYSAPTGYVSSLTRTISSLDFNVTINDNDDTSVDDQGFDDFYVELYLNNNLVVGSRQALHEGLNVDVSYEGLDSGVDYEIKVFAIYNLRDGYGDIETPIYARTENTIAKKIPVGNASSLVIDTDQVTFTFNYTDEDGVLVPDSLVAEIYATINDTYTLITSNPLVNDEVTFNISGFVADYDFDIKIACQFDLSDGNGPVPGNCLELELTTPANSFPEVIISNISINQENVSAFINVEDLDEVIVGNLKAQLIDGEGTVVSEVPLTVGLNDIEFTNTILTHSELYTVAVYADYNMKDTTGLLSGFLQENQIMKFYELLPEAHYYNVVVTNDSIAFDVTILDNDGTFIGNARAILLDNGVEVDSQILSLPTTSVLFDQDIISDHDYEVIFLIDYDNDNGNGTNFDYEMNRASFHVEANEVPTATVTNEVITSSDIQFDVAITDNDSVITGNVTAILYKFGNPTDDTITLTGSGTYTFTGLNSNTSYDILIVTNYDLRDLSDEVIGKTLVTKTNKTLENEAPDAVISNVIVNASSFTFDVDITDVDAVIDEATLRAVLYVNGTPTSVSQELDVQSYTGLVFSGLQSNTIYTVSIETDYDLRDGINSFTDTVLINNTQTTNEYDVPTALITYMDSDYDSITLNVDVVVETGVITTNLVAALYLDGVPTIYTEPLSNGINEDITFDVNVLSNETYEVKILVDYDLNDGFGVNTAYELDSRTETTSAKQSPNAILSNEIITNRSIQFDVEVIDPSLTIQDSLTAKLYKDGVYQENSAVALNPTTNPGIIFEDLEVGVEYEVRIEANYNNNIGNPDELFILNSFFESTRDIVILEGITNTPLEVYVDISVDDFFGILYDGYVQVTVFDKDSLEVADSFVLNVNTPTNSLTIDLVNYYNNHDYHLVFESKLNDGIGGFTTEILHEMDLTTVEKQLQSISLTPISVNATQVLSSVSIVLPDDEFNLITGTVYARLYEWDSINEIYVQIDEVVVIDGDNPLTFTPVGGTADKQFLLTIEAQLDWNEDNSALTEQILDQRTYVYTDQN